MAGVRFVINIAGISEVLTRPAAAAYLEGRAATAVASSGGTLVSKAGVSRGGGRVPARARVLIGYPASMPVPVQLRTEARNGTVARALGAAGGG